MYILYTHVYVDSYMGTKRISVFIMLYIRRVYKFSKFHFRSLASSCLRLLLNYSGCRSKNQSQLLGPFKQSTELCRKGPRCCDCQGTSFNPSLSIPSSILFDLGKSLSVSFQFLTF